MKRIFLSILTCFTLLAAVSAQTITEIVVNSPNHNTLEAAVIAAGLEGTLAGEGPFTLFAPTDAAFAALPEGVVESLLADPTGALTNVLLFHAVSGVADGSNIFDGLTIGSLQGQNLTFTVNDQGLSVNGINISVADIRADNGVVHVIDAVLVPEATPTRVEGTVLDVVVNSPDHNTLEAAVLAAGLEGALAGEGPFTLFAPTDAAFAALPEGVVETLLADPSGALTNVLLYHVVSGVAASSNIFDGQRIANLAGENLNISINDGGVFINGARVSVADIFTDNGVVHVIDAVIVPPASNTVLDVIANSPVHTQLNSLISAAGLRDALASEGPFTIFAPTDAAIAALPSEAVEALLADPTGALANVLLYHVVSGVAESGMLSDGQQFSTLLGSNITVTINNEGVFINGAQVTTADIRTDNGIVHVIDGVLLP